MSIRCHKPIIRPMSHVVAHIPVCITLTSVYWTAMHMVYKKKKKKKRNIQSNLNSSNIFETMETCSTHWLFEPLSVDHGARLGSKWQ